MKDVKLDDESLCDIAQMLKALSDATRLKIMQILHEGESCVGDIVDLVGTSQANVSKHLHVLFRAHLIKSRKEGTSVFYSLAGPFIGNLCNSICQGYAKTIKNKYQI